MSHGLVEKAPSVLAQGLFGHVTSVMIQGLVWVLAVGGAGQGTMEEGRYLFACIFYF